MNDYIFNLNSLCVSSGKNDKFTSVSLFSGGGGLDLGLSLTGFNFRYANDEVQDYCDTISYNFPECITEAKDILQITGNHIKKLIQNQSIALLAGGPPCQAFSILGRRGSFADARGRLVFEHIRLINEVDPDAFVFENVPGILTLNKGKDWKELLNHFEVETGYDLYTDILNSADYGVPQVRKRVFLVGFRQPTKFDFPAPTHCDREGGRGSVFYFEQENLANQNLPQWIPSKLALENVEGLPNHDIRLHGDRVRGRYKQIPPGGRDKVDHTDRINPERPSGTVLVGSKSGGGRPHIHPDFPRHITVREAARLQSFPDWYQFLGTTTAQYRQVGNAVPPMLAFALGKSIKAALQATQKKPEMSR